MPVRMHSSTALTSGAPDAAWALVGDVRRWPHWLPTVSRVTPLAPDAPDAVGARYDVRQPRLRPATWEITELEPGRSFTWVATAPGVRTTATHVVERTGDGTSITLGIRWEGPLAALIELLYGRLAQRYIETEAQTAAGLAATAA